VPISNFGCVHASTARCAAPDPRGWRDLARMGMQVALWLDGAGGERSMALAQDTGLAVICPEERLFLEVNGKDAVNQPLLQKLVGELIRAGASKRAQVVCCADGSRLTGLVCAQLQLALGVPLDDAFAELELFERAAVDALGQRWPVRQTGPSYDTTREYLSAVALAMRPTPPGPTS